MEELRRNARHRLMGSALLVLVGIIVFPLVFDTEPRTVAVNVAMDIPDRNTAAPLVVGTARPLAEPEPPLANAGLTPGEEQLEASAPRAAESAPRPDAEAGAAHKPAPDAASAAAGAEHKPEAKTEVKAQPRPEPKPDHKPEPKAEPAKATPAPAPAPSSEAQRARALLEGHAPAAVASAAAPAAAAAGQGERYIVQVGAYADQGKVREVRAQLERAGIKTYAQDIQGKGGVRTTRVRVGPFGSRAEAGKVLERVKGLGLDGVVLTL
ncbi:SPOR domain-containing protein [Comamonas sp. NLF-1-9]|uniref:SPOR domain-containing protein n=1 Tax=Comamonas sp. NLF-1-9 TaxID=2853163 RepID=UPI00351CC093